METNLLHQRTARFEKKQYDSRSHHKADSKRTLAGVPGSCTEVSNLLKLAYEPVPLAKIGVQLTGGLFADAVYFERLVVQEIVAPILGKASKMFKEFGVGTAYTLLRVSPEDSEILIIGASLVSADDRARFAGEVEDKLQRAADEFKLLARLAEMPAAQFHQAWFQHAIRPDPFFLPALRAVFDLNRLLAKHKAILLVNDEAVDLPGCNALTTKKKGGALAGVVGTLSAINTRPGSVAVTIGGTHTVSLVAVGKGYVDQLNQQLHLGDVVRITYDPIVDLLLPFEPYPSKGKLVEIELV